MSKRSIELQSSDGESVKIEEAIKHQLKTISEDNSNKNVISLENVTNRSFSSLLFHQFASAEENLPSSTSKELTMSKKQIELQSSNGESLKVEKPISHQSHKIENDSTKDVIITKKDLHSTSSNEPTKSKKMIVLQSFNGDSFDVEETIARQSKTISLMIDEDCTKNEITLENITSKILTILTEYCKKHHVDANSSSSSEDDLKKWDAKFMELDQTTIFQLILASNYLNIKGLHDLTCQTVADMIKGKTVDQIRAHFKIKNNFTQKEEKQLCYENQWVFD